MAKRRRKRKIRPINTAFKKANATCHAETSTPSAFGKCMSREMKKRRR